MDDRSGGGQSALVIGASRGIGRSLAETLAQQSWRVFAGCRHPQGDPPPGIEEIRLDVTEERHFESALALVSKSCGRLDALIYNAGITRVPGHSAAEVTGGVAELSAVAVEAMLRTNFVGAVLAAKWFGDLLSQASIGKFVIISSNRASLAGVETSNSIPYAASKVALNMLARKLALQWADRSVTVVAVHPGWVRTTLGGEEAPLQPAEAAAHLYDLIGRLGPEHSGTFLDEHGQPLPW